MNERPDELGDDLPTTPLPSDAEIERRMQEALERARRLAGHAPEAAGETPEEADRAAARLERIEADVDRGTEARFPEAPDVGFVRPRIPGQPDVEKGTNYRSAGVGLSMAYAMIGMTFLGWGLGKLWDMRAGGTTGQAIGTVIGALAGLGGAIYGVIRAQR